MERRSVASRRRSLELGSSKAPAGISRIMLNQAATLPADGSAVSPCLSAFLEETALPSAVVGPVARLCGLIASAGSILRHGDDVYWPRLLKFTILRREQPHALFKLRQSARVPVVVGVLHELLAQHEPWVDAE